MRPVPIIDAAATIRAHLRKAAVAGFGSPTSCAALHDALVGMLEVFEATSHADAGDEGGAVEQSRGERVL